MVDYFDASANLTLTATATMETPTGAPMGAGSLEQARKTRSGYETPQCGATDAAQTLGEQQQGIISILPPQPNERLVYTCGPKGS